MAVSGVLLWPEVRLPAIKSPLNRSSVVLVLRASTRVAPTSMKSPTWTVPRPPNMVVVLVRVSGSWVAPKIGSLIREARIVPAYLSAMKSIWTPL